MFLRSFEEKFATPSQGLSIYIMFGSRASMFCLQVYIILICLSAFARATTLTYKMPANDRGCFYATAKLNEKIAFYFSVQSGGNFEVDYEVLDPNGKSVFQGLKERQVDYVFTAQTPGDYSFCFFNQASQAAEKLIDFDVTVEQELAEWETNQKGGKSEQITALEHGVDNLNTLLMGIQKYQKYFRARENRNMYTVQSTETYIFWLSLLASALMAVVPVAQVLIVKTFFNAKHHYSSSMTSVNALRGGPAPMIPSTMNPQAQQQPQNLAYGYSSTLPNYPSNSKPRFL